MTLTTLELCELTGILFVTGMVKGTIGFGMAPLAVPLLAPVIGVKAAVALLNLPVFISSVQLCLMQRSFLKPFQKYWKLVAFQAIGVALGARFLAKADAGLVSFLLGICILVFSLMPLLAKANIRTRLTPTVAEPLVGSIGGVLGGATSIFGPFVAAYLSSRETTKDGVAKAINVTILLGSLVAIMTFNQSNQFEHIGLAMSALSFVPVGLGVWAGSAVKAHVPDRSYLLGFRTLLVIIALVLIARYLLK